MAGRLRLWKGYNNGILGGTLLLLGSDGVAAPVDLTSGAVSMEIYDGSSGVVSATIAGTIEGDPTDGMYSIIPGSTALNALTSGQEYNYRIKMVQNPTYPNGLLFEEDDEGQLLRCIVI